ncbi:MAG TPA: mitochondrial fission ELM1 family protein [Caulobacteraceae bacterium]|nr:mitochondrial fission ELM1 family protein [Caulobacteraceae bacterium]
MGLGAAAPISIWAVSDGRAGIEAQVVGLAEALARRTPASVIVKRIAWRGLAGALPARMVPTGLLAPSSAIAPPWPDLWIAAGRASLPLSIRVKRWSNGHTFVVQLQDPRLAPSLFDLVIPPRHDRLEGANVFPILGSPHRVTRERLERDYARFAAQLDALPRPRVAVLIGGRSKAHDLGAVRATAMAREIAAAVSQAGGSVMATFSRRTPKEAQAILAARLAELPGMVWNGEGENPYFAFLAGSDYILVTEDSTNMAAEAAATGKPVLVMGMDGASRKLAAFHDELRSIGAARPFEGVLQDWTYQALDETGRAADEILARMRAAGR